MRQNLACLAIAALAASAMPMHLSAQRGAAHFAIPHAPTAGVAGRGVLSEPQRPMTHVPYVRNNQWYGHAPQNDARFQLARPYQFGRFGQVGPSHAFKAARTDLAARRVWLPGGRLRDRAI